MTAPATITSPTHAVGVGAIIITGALALQMLTGVVAADALAETIGRAEASALVPAFMLVASIGALIAVWVVPCLPDPHKAMRVEAACKAALAATVLLYAYSITNVYGWYAYPTTETVLWGLGLSFTARSAQILLDSRRARRAIAARVPSSPVPLGDPGQRRE